MSHLLNKFTCNTVALISLNILNSGIIFKLLKDYFLSCGNFGICITQTYSYLFYSTFQFPRSTHSCQASVTTYKKLRVSLRVQTEQFSEEKGFILRDTGKEVLL